MRVKRCLTSPSPLARFARIETANKPAPPPSNLVKVMLITTASCKFYVAAFTGDRSPAALSLEALAVGRADPSRAFTPARLTML